MSLFYKMLTDSGALKHNGQSLWKYHMDEVGFSQLKKHLIETKSLNNIDPRDCTLYYAEWWKRCYNGGFPSKRDVFSSISNNHFFNEDEFYKYARKGATLLGIPWIRSQNTLYFKTMLLQGGLPIKHIANYKGAYKKFLLEILILNPKTIDDFAFDSKITSLLPLSSRNDEIYECCLSVVRAIINEDSSYLFLLDNNEELKEISNELRVKKQSLHFNRKKTKFKTNWVFEPGKEKIRLYLGIAENLDAMDFEMFFSKHESDIQLDYEYKLFFNDLVLCKFIKRANNTFRTSWINQGEILWDETKQFPELRLHSCTGIQYDCKHLISHLPSLDKPTLWTKYSEMQWLLEKGCHTSHGEANVLYPSNYHVASQNSNTDITICGKLLQWVPFNDSIVLLSATDSYNFKTNCSKIDWQIADEKPKWMLRTNLPVVRRRPSVFVYDENNNLIHNPSIKWRQNKINLWNDWTGSIPEGLVEIQIQVGNILETDEIFNIGALELSVNSTNLHQAEVVLSNNSFFCYINESPLVEIEKVNTTKIKFRLKNKTSIPSSIQASIKVSTQSKSLHFEILPPFKGVEILDNNQNIVADNVSFNLNNLQGYRLMSNQSNLVVNMHNTRIKGIIISEKLVDNFISLRAFEDKINQLYRLSDTMDNEAEIVLEIVEERNQRQTRLKQFKIKRYNQQIDWSLDKQNNLVITTKNTGIELYGIPLDCPNAQLNLYDLESKDGCCFLKNDNGLENFIIFSGKESSDKVQPAFISLNPNSELTSPEDRIERVIILKNNLLTAKHEDDIWQRLLSYYKICQNHDLQYSTFDILRTLGFSSELAAKAFVFFLCYNDTQYFAEDASTKMEHDLGFSFHWINKNHWKNAMEWMHCISDPRLVALVVSGIKSYFDSLHPMNHFGTISNYVLQDINPPIQNGFHVNGKISELRSFLGDKVLSQLPQKCPIIPESFKDIIPVNDTTYNVKLLLKSPISVALSIAGKDENLWSKENEYIRRSVRYSQQLSPEWYGEAINYCLTKI